MVSKMISILCQYRIHHNVIVVLPYASPLRVVWKPQLRVRSKLLYNLPQ